MSCLTRSQIETSINDAFSDLITNTALACEQINTEGKHNLWIMAGRIKFTYTSGANVPEWRTGSATTINQGTLSFVGSADNKKLRITYPSSMTGGGTKFVTPISIQVLPTANLINSAASGVANSPYVFAADADDTRVDIAVSTPARLTAQVVASGGGYAMNAQPPFPSNTFSSISPTYSSGKITVSTPTLKFNGIPVVFPFTDGGGSTPNLIPIVNPNFTSNSLVVSFYDCDNDTMLSGSAPSNLQFGVDYGFVNLLKDFEHVDFGTQTDIWFFGLFQTQP
ncbi:MAG: hypothetical protein JNK00_05165 [Flavipsychrobacter sp.]|nr:hypothetical protein [Flavipsychrobacter sp.]